MFRGPVERLLLSKPVSQYRFVNQGKTVIPGVDDGDMFAETDVSPFQQKKNTKPNKKVAVAVSS